MYKKFCKCSLLYFVQLNNSRWMWLWSQMLPTVQNALLLSAANWVIREHFSFYVDKGKTASHHLLLFLKQIWVRDKLLVYILGQVNQNKTLLYTYYEWQKCIFLLQCNIRINQSQITLDKKYREIYLVNNSKFLVLLIFQLKWFLPLLHKPCCSLFLSWSLSLKRGKPSSTS